MVYIKNPENIRKEYYKCGKTVGRYLISKGIPVLSEEGGTMLFAKTKKLQKALEDTPFYLKILMKVGVI